MICSQVFVILNFIGYILHSKELFEEKYLELTRIPWDITITISTISLMVEFQKYIVKFDLVSFLGFSKQFSSRFKKFTNFITLIIKITCLLFLILSFIKILLLITGLCN